MTSVWETHLEQVLQAVGSSATGEEAARKCSEIIGREVTANAVSSALRRLRREKGYKIPTMQQLMDRRLPFKELEEFEAKVGSPDPVIKIPKVKKGFDMLPQIEKLGWVPKKILVIPDIHFPNQDPYAIAALVAYMRDVKPDYIVFLGDVLDVLCLSRHPNSHSAQKLSDVKYMLQEEIDAARPLITEALQVTKGNVAWLEGNHEGRRNNLINANPGLLRLSSIDAKSFFQIPEEILWIEANTDGSARRLMVGNMFFEHGDKIINSRGSMHVANTMASRRPWCNTFVGHWHCVDRKSKVAYWPDGSPETFITASLGHLSKVKDHAHYAKLPNWTHGFGMLYTWEEDGKCRFSFDQIEMINYEFFRNGKLYSGKRLM